MVTVSKEKHLDMFLKMERIREFDSRINKLVRRGFVQGMTHFSVGEEAANVGAVAHLTYDDIIFSNHRGHGQSIAKDMDLNKMMAELAGKATGVSKGRGGSMHLADIEKGNYGTNGIVGGGYALAVGAALTQQYKGTNNIAVAFSGDGATNEGSFHESVNMAATWKLPVIFFIINNRYGISMNINNATNTPHLYTRAEAYGIPGFYCEDGNDVLAVYETMEKAVEHVRGGNGPAIVEVESYRWFGHSTADAGKYRTKEEVASWKEKDPMIKYRTYLTKEGIVTDEELDAIQEQVKKEIDDAYEFAQNSPDPELSVAFEDVWVD
ncbi:thiamine pyrophosphate-dependent dehydrogenase E1 component subunit alpha [Streptococcus parauberis]|uniref:Acetoin:2,6-dichlorophenolindophenol oxidoreductase subunit alpha n=3 Tax=Streptococcus parauberis TaxID=1348 RepID=A0A0E2UCL1_9STRE|nr:thiamine pyrophosphate-dependent dehydrogenase E1 component subunit alpha [Streptococcus parauberis]AUT06345.1 Pyruvate dehydrogenase (acetyl-transferring) [Streptococcus parauberis]EGE54565.1 TPP-dependent acetoin dehydrogenase complex, E1 component, alpha subunit [Streptococcus parauberis NCFD 2020]EMF50059.1 Acetoin dehydrogenase E1 component alpha-subunit [Streptococcus parauberis KRS-02109]EMG25646.1 Acetoin dehydrogenase E1 component alpha-subunit [Streptococcus parauberis KRS-02083]K